ncbi:MAG: CPBP family intramembrane metalloprotease [Oscillospiraceae bacterium]|nr:CPBP family intramembrane metalloprotease [Oscillospiraceae bacterium]
MKKLYEKSEILFALFWIVLYTVCMGNLRNLGDDSPYMTVGLIVISVSMLLFVWRNGLLEKYGLSGWAGNSKAMLWFLPLWIITTLNLWGGITPRFPMPGQLFVVVSMAFVGFAEELIFRGFLFKAMLKSGSVKTAVIVSSVTFGLGHILNLFTGHELAETLLQVVFAVAYGFLVTMVFYKSGSLLPCILSHSLFDVFAQYASSDASPLLNWVGHGVIIILTLLYCLYLTKRVETPAVNRSDTPEEASSCPQE